MTLTTTDLAASSPLFSDLVRRLSSAERTELQALLTPRLTPYIPWQPTLTQAAALLLNEARELLYGGAAGGGKSIFVLMAALQYVDQPEYSALILRRSLVDLQKPRALMDLAYDWLAPTAAQWSEKQKAWIFPSVGAKPGASLSFGYMESERDRYQYQGAAYQYVGFDELTQFTRTQYTYMFSRLRRLKESRVPLRVRASSNPGGDGHAWVFERFFTNGVESDKHGRRKRLFIPARLSDNPHLDAEEYEQSLDELPLVERLQLLHGDWTATKAGDWFRKEWWKLVERRDVPPIRMRLVRYWDTASTKPSERNRDPDFYSGTLMGEAGGVFYVLDQRRFRKGPAEAEQELAATTELDGPDVEVWMAQEPGSQSEALIQTYARTIFRGCIFRGDRQTGSKLQRAKPFSAACSNGLVYVVRAPWTRDFLDEHEAFPQPRVHDDQVDSASGAHQKLADGGSDSGPIAARPASNDNAMAGM